MDAPKGGPPKGGSNLQDKSSGKQRQRSRSRRARNPQASETNVASSGSQRNPQRRPSQGRNKSKSRRSRKDSEAPSTSSAYRGGVESLPQETVVVPAAAEGTGSASVTGEMADMMAAFYKSIQLQTVDTFAKITGTALTEEQRKRFLEESEQQAEKAKASLARGVSRQEEWFKCAEAHGIALTTEKFRPQSFQASWTKRRTNFPAPFQVSLAKGQQWPNRAAAKPAGFRPQCSEIATQTEPNELELIKIPNPSAVPAALSSLTVAKYFGKSSANPQSKPEDWVDQQGLAILVEEDEQHDPSEIKTEDDRTRLQAVRVNAIGNKVSKEGLAWTQMRVLCASQDKYNPWPPAITTNHGSKIPIGSLSHRVTAVEGQARPLLELGGRDRILVSDVPVLCDVTTVSGGLTRPLTPRGAGGLQGPH